MRKSKETERAYMFAIKRILIRRPDITLGELQKQLDRSFGYRLSSLNYINKLKEKVLKERNHRFDRATQKTILTELVDGLTEVAAIGQGISSDSNSTNGDRLRGGRLYMDAILKIYEMVKNSDLLAGTENGLTVEEMRRNYVVPQEDNEHFMRVMRNMGVIEKTEAMKKEEEDEKMLREGIKMMHAEMQVLLAVYRHIVETAQEEKTLLQSWLDEDPPDDDAPLLFLPAPKE